MFQLKLGAILITTIVISQGKFISYLFISYYVTMHIQDNCMLSVKPGYGKLVSKGRGWMG